MCHKFEGTMVQKTRKIKDLKYRCPHCGSSQVRHRKLIKNWKCDNKECGKTFKTPASDVKE
jgi:ribosomal protein L37AE/L43A